MDTIIDFDMPEKSDKNIVGAVTKYSKQLYQYIRKKVKSTEDAEDVLQEVWYQLSNIADLEALGSVSGWIYQVARNKVTDLYRKKKPESLEDFGYEDEDGTLNFKEILLLDDSGNPELALFKEVFWKELLAALDELPENQRQVFVMHEIEDHTLQEIATKLDENIKTIISRKGYAVKHLRKRLTHLYQELYT